MDCQTFGPACVRSRSPEESFNNQLDHPILVFHEGLSPEDALRIKEASPSRAARARRVDGLFRSTHGSDHLVFASVPCVEQRHFWNPSQEVDFGRGISACNV